MSSVKIHDWKLDYVGSHYTDSKCSICKCLCRKFPAGFIYYYHNGDRTEEEPECKPLSKKQKWEILNVRE